MSENVEFWTWRNALALFLISLLYHVFRALYSISPLHPLYRFPGPRVAAMTYLYEMYFDLWRWGRYGREIQRMHDIYGPIVRINPDELHCIDSDFSDEIFAVGGRKRDRWAHMLRHVLSPGATGSMFSTIGHDLHRRRRSVVQKFFSNAQILKLEPKIHVLAQGLCEKFLSRAGTSGPFDITMAYSCFTSDVISEYCFGEPFGLVEQDGFEPNFRQAVYSFLSMVYPARFMPWLTQVLPYVAPLMGSFLSQTAKMLGQTIKVTIPKHVNKVRADREAGVIRSHETIFDALLSSDLPPEEKTTGRLAREGAALLGGGTETASWALSVITFHLHSQPVLLQRVTEELQTVVEDPRNLPSWSVLRNLPYLRGVLLEGLRLSYGVSERLVRVIKEEDLRYRRLEKKHGMETYYDYVIPRDTPIGMSSWMMHHNEQVFRNSEQFRPERWVGVSDEERRELERNLFAFSKGSRQCIGMQLAYCEIYILLSALLLRVFPHMQLFETTVEDVLYDHDMLVPMTRKESKGVRVRMV